MSKVIEVKSCGQCVFRLDNSWSELCYLNTTIQDISLPRGVVHPDCPLKKESVTVKVKEE